MGIYIISNRHVIEKRMMKSKRTAEFEDCRMQGLSKQKKY